MFQTLGWPQVIVPHRQGKCKQRLLRMKYVTPAKLMRVRRCLIKSDLWSIEGNKHIFWKRGWRLKAINTSIISGLDIVPETKSDPLSKASLNMYVWATDDTCIAITEKKATKASHLYFRITSRYIFILYRKSIFLSRFMSNPLNSWPSTAYYE